MEQSSHACFRGSHCCQPISGEPECETILPLCPTPTLILPQPARAPSLLSDLLRQPQRLPGRMVQVVPGDVPAGCGPGTRRLHLRRRLASLGHPDTHTIPVVPSHQAVSLPKAPVTPKVPATSIPGIQEVPTTKEVPVQEKWPRPLSRLLRRLRPWINVWYFPKHPVLYSVFIRYCVQ